jgi:glycosyltransferase involved in cell wall biosynthesis
MRYNQAVDSRTPHVVFLASTLTLGGSERIMVSLAKGLPALGWSVSVVTLREPGIIGDELVGSFVPFSSNIAPGRYSPGNTRRIRRVLLEKRADLLYILDHENALLWGRLAAHKLGIPTIAALHSTRLWGGKPSLSWITRRMSHDDAAIVAVAEGQQRYLVQELHLPADKIRVIYNGVELERFANVSPYKFDELGLPYGSYIGFVGALRPEKNITLLIRTFSSLAADFPEWHLAIVGEGPEENSLRLLIRSLGMDDKIHLTGFKRDVERIYHLLDLVVLPSHPVVETLPLVLIEAGGAGVPVIATRVGSVDEVVQEGETGLIVPPNDEVALREAIRTLLVDEDLRKAMGRKGKIHVYNTFGMDQCLFAHDRLFRSILAETPKTIVGNNQVYND